MNGAHALAVNSATSGLHLALEAIGIRSGDEVILPTLTFAATAEAVQYLGARPVYVDVEPDTLNMNPELIEAIINERTRAIVPVHYGGLACNMPAIWEIASRKNMLVVEDAAHAFGSTVGEIPVGAGCSAATVFSFYTTKCITTGEGGMVMTPHLFLAKRMSKMRLHGIDRDAFDRFSQKNGWEYDVVASGFKYNMPDLLAAIGNVQVDRMQEMRERRAEIAGQYTSAFEGLPLKLPVEIKGWAHSWHLYVVRLEKGDRRKFIEKMAELGVMCSVHYRPLHKMSYWKRYGENDYPVADAAWESCVSLPIYSSMTDDQVGKVVSTVGKACRTL
jgi:dTDP-4-amino-4,6-dideoxygalactose transaminase